MEEGDLEKFTVRRAERLELLASNFDRRCCKGLAPAGKYCKFACLFSWLFDTPLVNGITL